MSAGMRRMLAGLPVAAAGAAATGRGAGAARLDRLGEPARVPPAHAAVAARRHGLRAGLALQPGHFVHRVPGARGAPRRLTPCCRPARARHAPASSRPGSQRMADALAGKGRRARACGCARWGWRPRRPRRGARRTPRIARCSTRRPPRSRPAPRARRALRRLSRAHAQHGSPRSGTRRQPGFASPVPSRMPECLLQSRAAPRPPQRGARARADRRAASGAPSG